MSPASEPLPAYEPSLDAYHKAFESELRHVMSSLPLGEGASALDAGCGDGFYTELLADRLGDSGQLTAFDLSPDYLRVTRDRLSRRGRNVAIRFVEGDVERLPFADESFDLAWCAQSFYSFPRPDKALAELARVTKPDGAVAVLENDSLHHVLLPWPPDVEILVRAAELKAFRSQSDDPEKYYVGRDLLALFRSAGLEPESKRTFSWDRVAPFDAATRGFLAAQIDGLRGRIRPHLSEGALELCDPYLDPASRAYVLNDPLCNAIIIDHVVWGRPRR